MKTALTVVALAWMSTSALAQSSSKETLRLTVGGQTLIIPVEFDAGPGEQPDSLRLSATTNLATVLPVASAALWAQMQNLPQSCEDRLSVNDTQISAGSGVLTATIDLTYEQWVCGRVLGTGHSRTRSCAKPYPSRALLPPSWKTASCKCALTISALKTSGFWRGSSMSKRCCARILSRRWTALNADASLFDIARRPWRTRATAGTACRYQAAQGGELSVAVVGPDSALALFRALDGLTGN